MTARKHDHVDPGLEAELRKLELKVKAAKERLDEVTSEYGMWHANLVRDLYADSGDPDRPARGRG